MDDLANVLSGEVKRAVVDQSGIPGSYYFALEWSPKQNADDAGPSIFTALSEQFGMRLELRKLPVSILAIDSISQTAGAN